MRPHRPPTAVSPASGVLRGLRAGVLAVLCVLLPAAGHVLARCHAPHWFIVAALAVVAVPGAVLLTRRRLTDVQVTAVLGVAQLAHHVVYALPGACSSVPQGGCAGGLSPLVEHDVVVGAPAGVVSAGHLVMLVLAARLLGLSERLLWQSRSLLAVVRRLLLFLWPLLGAGHGTGPRAAMPECAARPRPAPLVRLHAGRSPPRGGHRPLLLLRPTPIGGPRLL